MLDRIQSALDDAIHEVRHDTGTRRTVIASGSLLTAAAVIVGVVTLLPARTPDYETAQLDTIFEYTLLTEDFNNLPVDQRIQLIGELVERLRTMDTGESVLLAGFAAQIAGPMRDQLVRNGSKLMVDLTDDAASRYNPAASPADRRAFLEEAAVDFVTAMETMGGEIGDQTPEERLNDMRAQARRDMNAGESGAMSAEDSGRIVAFVNGTIGRNTSATQKARMSVFARDLTRVLRGQSLDAP